MSLLFFEKQSKFSVTFFFFLRVQMRKFEKLACQSDVKFAPVYVEGLPKKNCHDLWKTGRLRSCVVWGFYCG